MLSIAICDDNKYISSDLEEKIEEYKNNTNQVLEIDIFYTGEIFLEYLKNGNRYDLIFLDIELNTTTGIIVGNKIRKEYEDYATKIVFITGKDGYEPQLFQIQPFDFIRKPIKKEKLYEVLDLVFKLGTIENLQFIYKKSFDYIKVDVQEILYFEKENRLIKIVTLHGEDKFNSTLKEIMEKLPDYFCVPHNSFIVNFKKVTELGKEDLKLINEVRIPVSQRSLKEIRKMMIRGLD